MGDSVTVKSEQDVAAHKPVMLFGRDITEIPCFRSSFIFGICGGVVGGLACFLGTSKTLFSTHVAFASFWFGTFAYWIPCRYKFESKQLLVQKVIKENKERKRLELAQSAEDSS